MLLQNIFINTCWKLYLFSIFFFSLAVDKSPRRKALRQFAFISSSDLNWTIFLLHKVFFCWFNSFRQRTIYSSKVSGSSTLAQLVVQKWFKNRNSSCGFEWWVINVSFQGVEASKYFPGYFQTLSVVISLLSWRTLIHCNGKNIISICPAQQNEYLT